MSPLQILHEQLSATAIVITLIGQMDESNVDANAPTIYGHIDSLPQGGTLIMNFSGLEYMNSKSLGYTMDFFNKMNEKEGAFIIAEPQEQIKDILNVVGMSQVIPLVDSLKEARDMVLEEEGREAPAAPVEPVAQAEKISDPTAQQSAKTPVTSEPEVPVEAQEEQVTTEPQASVKIDLQKETVNIKQEPGQTPEITTEKQSIELVQEENKEPEVTATESVAHTPAQAVETSTEKVETRESQTIEQSASVEEPQVQETAQIPQEQETVMPTRSTSAQHEEEGVPILGIAAIIAVVLVILVLVLK